MIRTRVSKWVVIGVVAASMASVSRGFAIETPNSAVTIDVRMVESLPMKELGLNWFFQDTKFVTPNGGSGSIGSGTVGVIGLGVNYRQRLGPNSQWFIDGHAGYAIGSLEQTVVSGPFTFNDKIDVTVMKGGVGLGYMQPIGSRASVHATGGVIYMTTKAKFDDGTTAVDSEPNQGLGLNKTLGGNYRFNNRTSLLFEHYSEFTWNTAKDNGAELKETSKQGCYRGGLMFGF